MAQKKGERTKKKNKAVTVAEEERKSFSLARVKEFIDEVKVEFKKIVWPDKKVTLGSTGVVLLLVFLIAIYLGAVDMLIGKLVSYVLH